MAVSIVRDPLFLAHVADPDHPESPARLRAIDRELSRSSVKQIEVAARPATRAELERVHDPKYLDLLDRVRGEYVMFDPDTAGGPKSVDAAELAAGASIELCGRVIRGETPPGIALVRPPGHHALPGRSMGFCLLNNIAIAAAALRAEGAERVAIYDFDAHHGNGTEAAFYEDPDVLYMSTHQWPFYPGTGAADRTGAGAGEGATVNVPLPAGTGDEPVLAASRDLLLDRTRRFAPDIILLSAGFDGYAGDPLAGWEMTVDAYREIALVWRDLAEELTGGKIAAILEGGYDLEAMPRGVRLLLEAWG